VNARRGALLLAAGRVVLGSAVMGAPEKVAGRWLGERNAALRVVGDLARGLAIRDIALGFAALQTIDDPVAGPRIQAAAAAADVVDVAATVIARDGLPLRGVVGTVLIAGGAAAAGFYFAHVLAHAHA
jgi:hypothetical protein